jgi:hypothetical protein
MGLRVRHGVVENFPEADGEYGGWPIWEIHSAVSISRIFIRRAGRGEIIAETVHFRLRGACSGQRMAAKQTTAFRPR